METNPQFNDGAIPYGSRTETFNRVNGPGPIGVIGVYILESSTIKRPSKIVKRMDQIGGPTGSVGTPEFVEGDGVAQLSATTTPKLRAGDWFADIWDTSVGTEYFYIHNVSDPETQEGIKKQTFQMIKIYGTPP